MAKFRDFGSPAADAGEPITFKLYGEEFHCIPQIPGKVMLNLAAKTADEDNAAQNAAVIDEFFKYVLIGESYTRFSDLCMDSNRIVSIEQLMEIVSWLMETYSERPTTRSELSPSGQ